MPAKKSAKSFDIRSCYIQHLKNLLEIPSATNLTDDTAAYVLKIAKKLKMKSEQLADGTVRILLKGKDSKRCVGYGAHLDRIGLMVDALNKDGTISISAIGGLYPRHVEETVGDILTEKGARVPGVIYHKDTPIHKMGLKKFNERKAEWEQLRFRPDAMIGSDAKDKKKALEKLGVQIGDLLMPEGFLRIDEKNGTMRGRWMDNTLGCIALLALMEKWAHDKTKLAFDVIFTFSVAEEVGMGGVSVFEGMTDFVAVDVSVGEEEDIDMTLPTIKPKTNSLPFPKKLIDEFKAAAKKAKVKTNINIPKGGGTDAEQAKRAGFTGRIAPLSMPLYNMHSIEACNMKCIDGLIGIIDAHARV